MTQAETAVPTFGRASLVDLDAELFETLDVERRVGARRHAVVPVVHLEPGTWDPAMVVAAGTRPFAALVAEGLLVSEVVLGTSVAAELVGPGEIIDAALADSALLPTVQRWSAAAPVAIAVLDAHLLPALRAWPSVAAKITARAAARSQRLEVQRAISQLPRVEERLVALFAHLADRFGRVAADGIVVPLALTHQMLGRLVGARRPTVSLALKDLATAGTLQRRADGAWVLSANAAGVLETDPDLMPPPRPSDAVVVPSPAPVRTDPRISAIDVAALLERCRTLEAYTDGVRYRSRLTLERTSAAGADARISRRLRLMRGSDAPRLG
jgi:CRP/FNR family transcriptional regulator, cyclic AMP receptor protein